MTELSYVQVPRWMRAFPLVTGTCVAAIGAIVLVGWFQNIEILTTVTPRSVSMKANAAAAFVALGLSLALAGLPRHAFTQAPRWVLDLTALAIGLVTAAEYAVGADFGVDQLLTAAQLNEFQTAAPGRMSVLAAICIVLCSAALLAECSHTRQGRTVARALATCVGIVGLLSLLGYLYGAPMLYRPFAASTATAVHSAVAFVLLGAGIAALNPQYGLPSIASGRTLVGSHVRWLFPAGVLIPLLIGGFAVQTYEMFGVARASIALTAAGTTILTGLTIALAATWLRRMEDRLEVSNRALAATRQGVFIADGNVAGRPIIYVNEAFTQLSGHSEREALGRNCDFLVHAAAEDPALATLGTCLTTRTSCTVTLPCARRDGSVFSGRLSVSAVPGADDANHIVGLVEDVTAEQLAAMSRLELLAEASQARKDAETANRVKDVFFASITHDLRSPLNACLMWLDVLALGPVSEKSGKAIDAIKRNLKIQARLVNDLIDAAKISAGGIEIHPETLELETLIENHVETWQLMAAPRQVTFRYRPARQRHTLSLDSERMLQVLNNLLDNAFRNTPAGGNVELRVEPRGDRIVIEVEDDGTGLAAEDLKRVFTPFWRAARARSTRGSASASPSRSIWSRATKAR